MMERIAEPELMDEAAQARAYAEADFSVPHQRFIELFRARFPGLAPQGCVLDLGCGPGDITRRFARAYPSCIVHGIDAAAAMLHHAEAMQAGSGLEGRIRYIHGYLPGAKLPLPNYDVVISNSLLHHLADPLVLWQSMLRYAAPGAAVFVMDLMRPHSRTAAQAMVEQYAAAEPDVLRHDFFHSLLAAYTPEEVAAQLAAAGLDLTVTVVSDRHFTVSGYLP
ncbi:class I SAM-dependent methyltransferase [Sulfurivermis fontis]|uniref:class I SAM-dependent methyltransferase n=1 Tax=Sulfurivermis fontis TaxID=1972068 RepID=UPI000FD6C5E7|nr:class I SAM-dependent methyltransferase [Sulfurivermis fontis]